MDRIERQIIQALKGGELSVYELIDNQDSSLKELLSKLKRLSEEGYIEIAKGKVKLTKKGEEIQNIKNLDRITCRFCQGTGYEINKFFGEILEKYKEITKKRPEAIEKYDQGFISLDGVIRRVEFIYERGDLYGKIFVVGDDDLFSIAAGLTFLPQRILAVDIDERLVNFINKVASEYSLNVESSVYDVQKVLPDEYRGKFDVFVTDPVETIPGIKLFLSRGVSALKGIGCSGYFGLTTLEASRKKWYEIQRMLLDMGFVITDIRRKFNVYPGEEKNFFRFQEKLPIFKLVGAKIDYDWYKSSLYRIESIKDPKPVVEGEMIIDERVYKDDESLATPY